MNHEYLGESVAYQPLTCAEGWYDEKRKHTVQVGGVVISFGTHTKEGEPRTLHYCKECGERIKKQCDEMKKAQPPIPF